MQITKRIKQPFYVHNGMKYFLRRNFNFYTFLMKGLNKFKSMYRFFLAFQHVKINQNFKICTASFVGFFVTEATQYWSARTTDTQ